MGAATAVSHPSKALRAMPGTHTTYCHSLITRLPALISLELRYIKLSLLGCGVPVDGLQRVCPGGAGRVVPAAQPGLGTGSSAGA